MDLWGVYPAAVELLETAANFSLEVAMSSLLVFVFFAMMMGGLYMHLYYDTDL